MITHSIKTDNANVESKIALRKQATDKLESLKVLDLFAGENKLWKTFECEKYYGVEMKKGKGKNVNADNLRIIPSLDLSKFNVIDLDSYGIPFNQIELLYKNPTLQKGTVIIYTAITNKMSALTEGAKKMANIQEIYTKCRTLFNGMALELFYGRLYQLGVVEVTEYMTKEKFEKHYGFFTI